MTGSAGPDVGASEGCSLPGFALILELRGTGVGSSELASRPDLQGIPAALGAARLWCPVALPPFTPHRHVLP